MQPCRLVRCAASRQWSATCNLRARCGAPHSALPLLPSRPAGLAHSPNTCCAASQTPEKRAEGDEERGARLEAEGAARADAARRRAELLRQRLQEQQRREQVGSC